MSHPIDQAFALLVGALALARLAHAARALSLPSSLPAPSRGA